MAEQLKKGQNNDDMQESNRSLILKILSRVDVCTRVQIAEETGLQQATITKIMKELIGTGIVTETGNVEGKKGRRSIGLRLNADLIKVVAVKISKDMFQVGLFDIKGKLYEKYSESTAAQQSVNRIVRHIRREIDRLMRVHKEIFAIGIAVPGPFSKTENRILLMADRPGWSEVDLQAEFVDAYDIPVVIEHDANAGALAEWKYGTYGSETGTLVHFLASEGIGAGFISDGMIVRSSTGISTEVGHMSIDFRGERCSCGNYGCLRLYCSSLALVKYASEHRDEHPESILNSCEEITAEGIFDGMERGDAFCQHCVERAGFFMGCGLANIVNIYSPDAIRISDIMVGGGQRMLTKIWETIKERVLPMNYERLSIEYSQIKTDTILCGAAAIASDWLLDNFKGLPERFIQIYGS